MIGLVKGPSWYNPRRNPERATERRNFVLGEMHETGLIDDAEFQRATKAPLGVTKAPAAWPPTASRPTSTWCASSWRATTRPTNCPAPACAVMTGMSPAAQGYAEGAVTRTLKSLSTQGDARRCRPAW